jgi:MerR family transcriptional regulator/heat shock protein HspR
MRREEHAVYVISVAAELAGVHPQTLRIYERRGLLSPARTAGGNRRYSDADINRLRRIAELAAQGMNLEGIRHVMSLEAENASLRHEVQMLRAQMKDIAHETERSMRRDLVPLRQAITLFTQRPGIFGGEK